MDESLIKKLSAKYDLDEDVIERIIRSEFEFTARTMEAGEFQSVRLHHLGCFAVKPNRLKQLEEMNENKNNQSQYST